MEQINIFSEKDKKKGIHIMKLNAYVRNRQLKNIICRDSYSNIKHLEYVKKHTDLVNKYKKNNNIKATNHMFFLCEASSSPDLIINDGYNNMLIEPSFYHYKVQKLIIIKFEIIKVINEPFPIFKWDVNYECIYPIHKIICKKLNFMPGFSDSFDNIENIENIENSDSTVINKLFNKIHKNISTDIVDKINSFRDDRFFHPYTFCVKASIKKTEFIDIIKICTNKSELTHIIENVENQIKKYIIDYSQPNCTFKINIKYNEEDFSPRGSAPHSDNDSNNDFNDNYDSDSGNDSDNEEDFSPRGSAPHSDNDSDSKNKYEFYVNESTHFNNPYFFENKDKLRTLVIHPSFHYNKRENFIFVKYECLGDKETFFYSKKES